MRKVLAVGDLHFPWVNKRTLNAIYRAIEREQPDIVIQMGDLYDMFSSTRFAKTMRLYTPLKEVELAREMADEFWAEVKKRAPKAKRKQIKGNHDDRPYKRLIEKAPELEPFFSVREYFEFEGVETIHDSSAELEIDGILYIHGHYSGLGKHMQYFLKRVVCAHSHVGGSVFANLHSSTIWELNVGYAADKYAVPLRYSPSRTVRWTQGYGIIDDHGPRFIHLPG